MKIRNGYLPALLTLGLLALPAMALNTSTPPAPCPTEDAASSGVDKVGSTATTVSKDTTTLTNAGTQLHDAQTKFSTMVGGWGKPKSATTAAKPASATKPATTSTANTMLAKATPPSASGAASGGAAGGGDAAKKPCKPADGNDSTAAGGGSTGGKQGAGTGSATGAAAAGSSTFTKMPDGDFMLGYTEAGGAQPTYAKVKEVSATPTAANPHDGVYTDGKSYFMMSNGKLTVTPIGK